MIDLNTKLSKQNNLTSLLRDKIDEPVVIGNMLNDNKRLKLPKEIGKRVIQRLDAGTRP